MQAIPVAIQKAKPRTPEFRAALRDALMAVKGLTVSHGVMTMSPENPNGLDARARLMITIHNRHCKL